MIAQVLIYGYNALVSNKLTERLDEQLSKKIKAKWPFMKALR